MENKLVERLEFRLTTDELNKLKFMAKKEKTSVSELIRNWINQLKNEIDKTTYTDRKKTLAMSRVELAQLSTDLKIVKKRRELNYQIQCLLDLQLR